MSIKRTKSEPLNDLAPMPFGKYKGTPMQDIPAEYLHWLWENGVKSERDSDIHQYIVRSISALKAESPDLIWSKL